MERVQKSQISAEHMTGMERVLPAYQIIFYHQKIAWQHPQILIVFNMTKNLENAHSVLQDFS